MKQFPAVLQKSHCPVIGGNGKRNQKDESDHSSSYEGALNDVSYDLRNIEKLVEIDIRKEVTGRVEKHPKTNGSTKAEYGRGSSYPANRGATQRYQ